MWKGGESMKVVELFSGIGSQIRALNNVAVRYGFEVDVVNTCEWDIHAIVAYDLIHNGGTISEDVRLMERDKLISELLPMNLSVDGKTPINCRTITGMKEDMLKALFMAIRRTKNLINISDVHDSDFSDDFDLLTYSFPCQDLSNVGALHGYTKGIDRDANTRSGLLWEVERILLERNADNRQLPKYLLLENVTALLSDRHRKNFEEWQRSLDGLGYVNHVFEMYAPLFGIPQNRKRLLMLSVLVGEDAGRRQDMKCTLEHYAFDNKTLHFGHRNAQLYDFLMLDYTNQSLLDEALISQPNDTESRKRIWNENLKIVDEGGHLAEKVATLTTKQDRHPNSGNIHFQRNNGRSSYRFLTPRECFKLMGFIEPDYEIIGNSNLHLNSKTRFFSRDKMYRLTGNSIVVNVLEGVFEIVAILERDSQKTSRI